MQTIRNGSIVQMIKIRKLITPIGLLLLIVSMPVYASNNVVDTVQEQIEKIQISRTMLKNAIEVIADPFYTTVSLFGLFLTIWAIYDIIISNAQPDGREDGSQKSNGIFKFITGNILMGMETIITTFMSDVGGSFEKLMYLSTSIFALVGWFMMPSAIYQLVLGVNQEQATELSASIKRIIVAGMLIAIRPIVNKLLGIHL